MPDPNRLNSYFTLAAPAQAEIKVQKSRFLAEVVPVTSLDEAKEALADISRRYHDCRHVCYAWRGGTGLDLQEIRNDGGEPSGTAGEPILAALRQADVTDCVAVVARYFGGIKLGTGGLARAYGQATAAALALAERLTVNIGRQWILQCPYAHQKTVTHLLARFGGRIVAQEFTEQVVWQIWLPESGRTHFGEALSEATAGAVQIKAPT